MEELPGTTYLYNLSLIAVTFSAVSALVMLIRQSMGGKLSNFDIYLIVTYVSLGFVVAVAAVLPPLVALFAPSPTVLWGTASGLAAILVAAVVANSLASRRRAATVPMSSAVTAVFAGYWIAALLFAANAVVGPIQGVGVHAVASTLFLVVLMVAFVRRIASLLGDKPGDDWDPGRG